LRVDLGAAHGGAKQAGRTLHLTPTEFKLLARLVRSAGRVVTHRQLLTDVWGAEFTEHTHYLRLYMGQLRAKIEHEPAEPQALADRNRCRLPPGHSPEVPEDRTSICVPDA
jgi:two-component system KDP operon response regulator KdpE